LYTYRKNFNLSGTKYKSSFKKRKMRIIEREGERIRNQE